MKTGRVTPKPFTVSAALSLEAGKREENQRAGSSNTEGPKVPDSSKGHSRGYPAGSHEACLACGLNLKGDTIWWCDRCRPAKGPFCRFCLVLRHTPSHDQGRFRRLMRRLFFMGQNPQPITRNKQRGYANV